MGKARLAAREGVAPGCQEFPMFIILIIFKLGKATANFAHWSHAGWGFDDWNRSALILKLIFKGK